MDFRRDLPLDLHLIAIGLAYTARDERGLSFRLYFRLSQLK